MSSTKPEITPTARRIIDLSSSYATDKAFLKRCEITNLSFVTDLKKGRTKTPGADKLAQIVRGTGCSGTWLLTGEGEKFPPERPPEGIAAEEGVKYISDFMKAQRLIEKIAQRKVAVQDADLIADLSLQASKLTTALLELQQEGKSGRGG